MFCSSGGCDPQSPPLASRISIPSSTSFCARNLLSSNVKPTGWRSVAPIL
ncbi:MAG: hypothetical protein ACTSYM_04735 [Candidatus Baldrarchaeia archaeon]